MNERKKNCRDYEGKIQKSSKKSNKIKYNEREGKK